VSVVVSIHNKVLSLMHDMTLKIIPFNCTRYIHISCNRDVRKLNSYIHDRIIQTTQTIDNINYYIIIMEPEYESKNVNSKE